MKASIARKRTQKSMPPDALVEVYVSRISLAEGTLEVCLNREEALTTTTTTAMGSSKRRKTSASSLQVGDEIDGIVSNVTPYGVFVDVHANRNGLLHISKVAKQKGAYVAKEDGLKELGLGRGSQVSVVVVSNEKKRLELDLAPPTPPVFDGDSSHDEERAESSAMTASSDFSENYEAYGAGGSINQVDDNYVSDEEAAMWAAYSINETEDESEDDEEYDEDTDIEDALGIGTW